LGAGGTSWLPGDTLVASNPAAAGGIVLLRLSSCIGVLLCPSWAARNVVASREYAAFFHLAINEIRLYLRRQPRRLVRRRPPEV